MAIRDVHHVRNFSAESVGSNMSGVELLEYTVDIPQTPDNQMAYSEGDESDNGDYLAKPMRPLTQELKIPSRIVIPYRLLIVVRMVVLGLFLQWRIRHPNEDARWLWLMSIICELWFAFSWLLDQIPKFSPVSRATDLSILKERFEKPNPNGKSYLPGVDIFVSTADPEKEPLLVTANTILSILAADYPTEKLSCFVSDDGASLFTFVAMAEAARFAELWVPFCRKHEIELRSPEPYFNLKLGPFKNVPHQDFMRDHRKIKREYNEFKVRINAISSSIQRRSDTCNVKEQTTWQGTWTVSGHDHAKGDHAGIIQVMLDFPGDERRYGTIDTNSELDFTEVDIRLPKLVYVSREKRPGYDHNKKAGAMNALVRASAIMSNGPFILNLDCDHYIYNSQAIREGLCFMMDRCGDQICFVQFPQRFEGIDPSDRYASVFFDVNMRALDGLQGPVYVGSGCLFRRTAIYGFDPPIQKSMPADEERQPLRMGDSFDEYMNSSTFSKRFGNSGPLNASIPIAKYEGRPLADNTTINRGRTPGAPTKSREQVDNISRLAEAIYVISCSYEDKTEWGNRVGWTYGSVTEDVVMGYQMHNRGWKSVYCVTKRDAFRGTAPIDLTDRLHQLLRWATGSVEIFFSNSNPLLASWKMKLTQRIAYLNISVYPFTSLFLILYCFIPAFSLFSGQFPVATFSVYLLIITLTMCALSILEIEWSGISMEEWWRNEQFWLIGGTSAHLAAVIQGLLRMWAGIEISFNLTSKSAYDIENDYVFKWSSLMIMPTSIIMTNLMAISFAFCRTIYSVEPHWSGFIGGVFFSLWVLAHLYPFAKGLMGRRGSTQTVIYTYSGLVSILISLLWLKVSSYYAGGNTQIGGAGPFQFPW